MEKIIKFIRVYFRNSTPGQEEEKTIEAQRLAVHEYAEKNGYIIVQEYKDEGWSGDSLARPGLDQLRADVKSNPQASDAVLFYDPDRLARRYSYQELVMDELKESNNDTLFVTIPPPKSDEDRIMYGMRGLFSQYERMKIAERFRLGKVRKARAGHIIASEAPYGYTLIVRQGKRGDSDFCDTHYEINEEEARVVRLIFSWIADDGLTLRKIVKRLNDLGIKPRKSPRGVWNTSTLSTLVRNRSYIGEGHYGASYAVMPEKPLKKQAYRRIKKTSRKMKPVQEWIKIAVPAILAGPEGASLFGRAQQQMKDNFVLARRNRINPYLLSGKIRCTCGCTRTGEGPQKGKHLYYRCSNRVISYPLPRTCNEKGLNARIADEKVWSHLHGIITSKERITKYAREWVRGRNESPSIAGAEVASLRNEIAKLKAQEDRYAKAFGQGVFTMEKFQEYVAPVREKITTLEHLVASKEVATQVPTEKGMPDESTIDAFVREAQALVDLSFEEKRAIVGRFVDRIEAVPGRLQVHGRIDIPNHVEFKTSNRHGPSMARHNNAVVIPFELHIKLPPTLRTGIDYGFLPGKNVSARGKGTV